MTITQCNRPRRCGCLQCVRDGQRTRDHENSARHATKKQHQHQYCMRYVPAAMMHGGGVPFMITTKFASREKNKKHKLITKITKKAPSLTTISTTINSAHTKTKQPCQLTSSSIKQTYWRDQVDPNEKDGPKMTTTQCNRRRR